MRLAIAALSLLGVFGMAACSGFSQVQDTITKFSSGTHTAATAEMNFLHAVQNADCTRAFYASAAGWALGTASNFDISGACTPTILDDRQIVARQALVGAIALYADKMAALATSDNDKSLDANGQKLATNLNGLAKQQGVLSSLTVASGVEAAIIAIAQMALDEITFKNIKSAASQMAPHLQAVVTSLQAENTGFAVSISSKLGSIEGQVRQVVVTSRRTRGATSFFDVVAARNIVRSANPFSPQPLAATPGTIDPATDPKNVAVTLNRALDAVVNANASIASAGTGGIIAAVDDLVARAQDAQSIAAALNK